MQLPARVKTPKTSTHCARLRLLLRTLGNEPGSHLKGHVRPGLNPCCSSQELEQALVVFVIPDLGRRMCTECWSVVCLGKLPISLGSESTGVQAALAGETARGRVGVTTGQQPSTQGPGACCVQGEVGFMEAEERKETGKTLAGCSSNECERALAFICVRLTPSSGSVGCKGD